MTQPLHTVTWIGFRDFIDARAAWSRQTFGPGDRHRGLIEHIRRELLEIERDPTDLEEWIDVINLALDGASRCCHASSMDVAKMLIAKHEKNMARTWPDWRTLSPDEPAEHVRGDV